MTFSVREGFFETVGREALRDIQIHRFQTLVDELLVSNVFYQKKLAMAGLSASSDISAYEDLRGLPFTTKDELVRDQLANPPYGTNLTFGSERFTKVHQTSGTTGEPLRVLDTEESWGWIAKCWHDIYRAAGVTERDRIFFAFSFGPFLGFWSAYDGANRLGALAVPGGGMTSSQRARAILANDITVLVCTPTYALHLAEVGEQEGLDLASSNVQITIHAGEPGASLPSTKGRIEEAWGARCYDHAGATEVGAWGFECQAQRGLHVNETEFIYEIVDPATGEPATEGELVMTNLGRRGMPVIRYRTGDRVRLAEDPCPCGRTYALFDGGVMGRIDDVVIVRGVNVFPSAIENVIRRHSEVGEFAVDIHRRDELDEMEIRIEVNEGDPQEIAHRVELDLRHGLGLRARITEVPTGTLPRFDLKAKRLTDHRKLA